MAALPFSRPLVYWEWPSIKNQRLKLKMMMGRQRVGGEAWLNKGCSTYQQLYMNSTHYI